MVMKMNRGMKQRKHRAWVEIPGSNKRFFYYIKIGESVPPTLSVISWCEFSGFEDDKETAIFEGDVCQGSYICPACYDTEPHILTGEVVYDNGRGMWRNGNYKVVLLKAYLFQKGVEV